MKKPLRNKEIDPNKWYLAILLKPKNTSKICRKLYNREFIDYYDVLYFIKINNREKNLAYTPIRGIEAIEHNFTFFKNAQLIRKLNKMLYYSYPLERDTTQARKSFRTKARRWFREYKLRLNKYNDFLNIRLNGTIDIHPKPQSITFEETKGNTKGKRAIGG